VTPRVDEIQKLIADVDNLLATAGKRLPKLLSSQAPEARETLERIRDFLVKLGESEALDSSKPNKVPGQQPLSPLLAKFIDQSNIQSSGQHQQPSHVVPQELSTELSELIQPLRIELAGLLQERANLVQEIRLLEQRRSQNYSLSQQLANQEQVINEFLQVLMNRLVPSLAPQLGQTAVTSPGATTIGDRPQPNQVLESSDQTERLTLLTRNLDQRLLSLDGTVNVVFEALQRNINTYHQSLSQSLARMHNQGLQGEQLMASFVQNLTQYLPPPSPSYQPSFLGIQNQTLAAADNLLETVAPFTVKDEPEDPVGTDDLDAVLLQLSQDLPQVSETTITKSKSQPDRVDEVDQLYASLFGTSNVTNQTPAVPLPVVASELSTLITDAPDVLPGDAVQPVDPGLEQIESQDATVQPTDASSQLWEALFLDEDPEPAPPVDLSSLLKTKVAATETLPSQLASIDTITALTDLLTDFDDVSYVEATTTVAEKSEVVISDEEEDNPSDNYILASPQENLLSQGESLVETIPDISLDDVQLQQLELDLAQLDGSTSLASESQQELHTDHQPTTAFSRIDISQIAPTAFPQPEVELDFSPTTEKKTEVTNPVFASSTPSIASNLNNPGVSQINVSDSVWYLGIDLGTTGISAALLNRSTFVVYPIYWSAENQAGTSAFQQSFRLPAEVYLPTAAVPPAEAESTEVMESAPLPELTNNLHSAQLKPYLQVAIPYRSARQKWEPVLQFNQFSAGPLVWVVRSLSKLLLTLKSDRNSTTQGLTANAVGLDEHTFTSVMSQITGVICTCPSGWSEQYRFNVREALLTSKIVQYPQQVFFIEEAIASLLSVLDGANGETIQLSDRQGLRPTRTTEQPLVGSTLAINIGATATEMTLVDLPESLLQLAHHDFMLHSFAYAGKGIEQDIICQLLLPPKSRQSRAEIQGDNKTITSNPWHWQPTLPGLDQMCWQSLGLEALELPRVGEPDITVRIRLQQHLESSLLGQAVLDAALALKLILQHQESFTLDLADQRWVLQRRDLESQVLVPFVRRLNRELNKLLVARGIPTEAINQAILTGGVAAISTVNRWLRQKLPNAKIIQDSYLGDHGALNCSGVAYGLAMLPLHPQVLDIPKQQYTDYFLFTELLRLLPERSLSFNEVLQLFEGRGINTRTCQQRLLAFLEGELPPGLIPNSLDFTWLTQSSQENVDYQAIAATPLFEKQGSLSYRPHAQQLLILRRYLDAIQASTQQSLDEPYTVNFALENFQ
jgi:hypothetical protein